MALDSIKAAQSHVESARDTIANIAAGMTAEQARAEEWEAAVDQAKRAMAESVGRQYNEAIRFIAELLACTFEIAAQRVAERMAAKTETT